MNSRDTDAEQCRTVLIDFLGAIDGGRASEALHLFTPDAIFDARGTTLCGHEQITCFLAARQRETDRHTVHVITNDAVRRHDDHELELTALLMLYEHRPDRTYQVDRVLDTTRTFRRHGDSWRISSRTTRPIHPTS